MNDKTNEKTSNVTKTNNKNNNEYKAIPEEDDNLNSDAVKKHILIISSIFLIFLRNVIPSIFGIRISSIMSS